MTVAALYDIHGNLAALQRVLQEISQLSVDRIVVGGDVVPGPQPVAVIQALKSVDVPMQFIQGNGERNVLDVRAGRPLADSMPEAVQQSIRWVANQLTDEVAEWMQSWPSTLETIINGVGGVLFCHATPTSDSQIFTRETPESRLRPIFDPVSASLVVCGHTHMPFDRQVGKTRVVNAGSVGMPFGRPGADWLLLDPDVQFCHCDYDLLSASQQIRASGYPQATEFADKNVLHPPAESDMLSLFEQAALR